MKKKGCLHLPVYVQIGLSDAVFENEKKNFNNCNITAIKNSLTKQHKVATCVANAAA